MKYKYIFLAFYFFLQLDCTFGQELKKVEQKDRNPKKAFVLGVYASAVHARWVDQDGKEKVKAMAVASEPEIFWTGENAAQIISKIKVPEVMGQLEVPGNSSMNGPSGRALDDLFLKPLGLNRQNTWLCDLLPESRVNEKQRSALDLHYTSELIQQYGLNPATIPDFDKTELNSHVRHQEILNELEESKADTLIVLGDLPIYWFLRFHAKRYKKLSQFGDTEETYGLAHKIKINNKSYQVIPLCHPRQAGRLGSSNSKWGKLHDNWISQSPKSRIY